MKMLGGIGNMSSMAEKGMIEIWVISTYLRSAKNTEQSRHPVTRRRKIHVTVVLKQISITTVKDYKIVVDEVDDNWSTRGDGLDGDDPDGDSIVDVDVAGGAMMVIVMVLVMMVLVMMVLVLMIVV